MTKRVGKVLLAAVGVMLIAVAAAVAGGKKEAETPATGIEKTGKYGESPLLAQLVVKGELDPVEKRLPENPMTLDVVDEIGQYGGTWRKAWTGPGDKWGVEKTAPEYLLRWSPDGTKLLPNVAESYEVLEDGKIFVFHLRKGLRWSDGAPFTTDDVMFAWENHLLNKEITPKLPSWWLSDGAMPKVDRIDDYTFRISHSKPHPLFLYTFIVQQKELYLPKHYLKQFHAEFTPKETLDKLVQKEGVENWVQLYNNRGGQYHFMQAGCPSLRAWYPSELTPSRFVLERNPYFWKVDPEGNQLPYIDRIVYSYGADAEIIIAKAMSGDIDCQYRHMDLQNYTLFKENEKAGDYRVLLYSKVIAADPAIKLNQTVKDPVLRRLFQDVRFRAALSLAINRQKNLDVAHKGIGEARQASIVSGAPYYSEKWEHAYVEYDPRKAGAFLDELGLKWDADHKFRLRPDGETLTLLLETGYENLADTQLLVKQDWEAVGVQTLIRNYERSLYEQRLEANDLQIGMWPWGLLNFIMDPRQLVPTTISEEWSSQYGLWYSSGGTAGVKPSGDVMKLIELWDKIRVSVDEEQRSGLAREIVELHAKNIWVIGAVGEVPGVVIVKNNFRNVPETMIVTDTLRDLGHANPPQFFIKK